MARPVNILKVGGSLYDLPDLGSRLQPWLSQAKSTDIILVPGGGVTVDVIRDFDRIHRLGEKRAHWLALYAMRLNAEFLAKLLQTVDVMKHWNQMEMLRSEGRNHLYSMPPPLAFGTELPTRTHLYRTIGPSRATPSPRVRPWSRRLSNSYCLNPSRFRQIWIGKKPANAALWMNGLHGRYGRRCRN